jgi:DNA-binding CsgD family transcriptional regulator
MEAQKDHVQWHNLKFNNDQLDYSILERHIQFLESIKSVHNSAIAIFDLARMQHVYLSSAFESLLGWDLEEAGKPGHAYIDSRLHPDDLEHLNRNSSFFFSLILKIKKDDPKNIEQYKFIMDYRTKGKDGQYKRVIEQHKILEFDPSGNLWLSLGIMDLSPDQDLQTLCRYRMVNVKTGEVYHFPKEDPETILSLREQEILQLIAKGLVSKQIADHLFISVNTVNTHRQRIIEKLNVSNTAGAIQYALNIGII